MLMRTVSVGFILISVGLIGAPVAFAEKETL
jgi:hypothetical protein